MAWILAHYTKGAGGLMKRNDTVRILADRLPAALVTELGAGRHTVYIGQVIATAGTRVQVRLLNSSKTMWFDADVLSTDLTLPLEWLP